ncbi:MAG TPA: hypothetical protein IAD18_01790 [Candidatus Limisoma intestinavium]|uniref:Uncharacterized protein n=1 Tax=Candidatus Limisoma intestinavium TaxID=2840856 RepID=A0A9D1LG68_9BACT|nr:hypothetical protein [Candidatus Limisoma intestinavium]
MKRVIISILLLSIAFAGDCQNYFCEYAKSCRILTDSILAELGINGRPAIITSIEGALTKSNSISIYVKEADGYYKYFAYEQDGKITILPTHTIKPERWKTIAALFEKRLSKPELEKRIETLGLSKAEAEYLNFPFFAQRDSVLDIAFNPSAYNRKNKLLLESEYQRVYGAKKPPRTIYSVVDPPIYFVMLDGAGNRYGEFCISFISAAAYTFAYGDDMPGQLPGIAVFTNVIDWEGVEEKPLNRLRHK